MNMAVWKPNYGVCGRERIAWFDYGVPAVSPNSRHNHVDYNHNIIKHRKGAGVSLYVRAAHAILRAQHLSDELSVLGWQSL